jgi:hypothetical protein
MFGKDFLNKKHDHNKQLDIPIAKQSFAVPNGAIPLGKYQENSSLREETRKIPWWWRWFTSK